MPIYQYRAEDKNGRSKTGKIVGLNDKEAESKLRKKDLAVVSLKEAGQSFWIKLSLLIQRVRSKDLVIFSRQFSVMISANMPVVESLMILVDQTNNFALKSIVADIALDVDSGALLSDAFARQPQVFSAFFVNIIKSGETSGKLDEVLNYLADEMEKNYDMVSKIKGAMVYPVFIICGLVGVGLILMVYVIPNLTSILTETGLALPWSTRVVIWTSNFLRNFLWLVILLLVGAGFLLRFYLKTATGRRNFDLLKIKLPVFGRLFKYIYLMRFTRSLNTLLKGGVTITKSLEITADVVRNEIFRELIMETLQSIKDGNPLATVFEDSDYIPKMVPQMISVGERSGKIEVVLEKISDFYTRESSAMLNNLSTIMEPLIMVIMGIGVAIMVAAVILPMYNLGQQF
ncbi:MAG: type II secretion system F family protein [Candidatus Falkowbacteria bacterium]|nr:type II secretion system F family protein [Candidatus Falkowbacteria bacterium]